MTRATGLDEKQREMVCGVWIDMSAAYINAIQEHLLHAEIVHDKFHISQKIGYAVDKTRRVSMPCFRSRITNR